VSRHFKGERFGYCVDHWSIPEPYVVVDRITSFLSAANDPEHNIGFYPGADSWVSAANNASVDLIDDRWPAFDIREDEKRCKIQYSASHGHVYQTFKFENGRPSVSFMAKVLICELEFSDPDNKFNIASKSDDEYKVHLLSDGKCIKRSHKLSEDGNKHAALLVYACSGGAALNFREENRKGEEDTGLIYYTIEDSKVSDSTEITFVYVLSLINGELEYPPEPPEFTTVPELAKVDTSKERIFTSKNADLNIALRRNLEYILSVCSIPVYPNAENGEEFAVALTCGDVDSHRISTAASL
jgi:hypothetical protein